MSKKVEIIMLAFLGVLIIVIAGYTQFMSIDFDHSSIIYIMRKSIKVWLWWTIVGIPFITGAAFLIIAFITEKIMLSDRGIQCLFAALEIFSILLAILIGGIGYFIAISCGVITLSAFWRNRMRHKIH
ncbi:MAG TPA: hypothetical protein VN693_03550 [Rhodanobacteraceae bacterium]|nr:hypothetical protein [Rhodanobacteraceae bacterium]